MKYDGEPMEPLLLVLSGKWALVTVDGLEESWIENIETQERRTCTHYCEARFRRFPFCEQIHNVRRTRWFVGPKGARLWKRVHDERIENGDK